MSMPMLADFALHLAGGLFVGVVVLSRLIGVLKDYRQRLVNVRVMLSLRRSIFDPLERASYSAVVGILGAMLVPFIHLSVYMFRTIHPKPVILNPEGPTLPGSMLSTLLEGVAIMTVMYLGLVLVRYGIGRLQDEKEARHAAQS